VPKGKMATSSPRLPMAPGKLAVHSVRRVDFSSTDHALHLLVRHHLPRPIIRRSTQDAATGQQISEIAMEGESPSIEQFGPHTVLLTQDKTVKVGTTVLPGSTLCLLLVVGLANWQGQPNSH
jgi:hypothetical protein